jgi:division protein CdvB (Snf7/Vps24/ESCRT-III family)
MAFLFGGAGENSGRPKSQSAKVSEQRAQLRSGVRALAREESKSAKEEQTLIADIKRLAKCGDIQRCTSKAKELVRVRAHIRRVQTTQSQLSGISRQLGTLSHTVSTGESLAKLTLFLRDMNQHMDVKSMNAMLNEFSAQQLRLGETTSIMEEHMDEAFEAEDEETCTADALAGAEERYRAAGLDAYLSKPITPAALFAVLADLTGAVPSAAPPKSLTTTLAPRAANCRACSRPSPPPAPVTITTR